MVWTHAQDKDQAHCHILHVNVPKLETIKLQPVWSECLCNWKARLCVETSWLTIIYGNVKYLENLIHLNKNWDIWLAKPPSYDHSMQSLKIGENYRFKL
jgi:hypothetical protein